MMNREQIKTLILTLLIIMSVVFTQKIWFYSPLRILQSEASFKERQASIILETRGQLVIPEQAIISFGNNNYTIISSNMEGIWRETRDVLSQYFNGEPEVTPSTYEKYRENSRLKSIELQFGKNIPSVLVSSVLDTVDNKVVSSIKEISSILIPTLNRGIIYIVGKDNNIYEIKLDDYAENRQLMAYIDNLQTTNYVRYYPLFADVGNYTVMPLNYEKSTPKVFVESEIKVDDEEAVIERAKSFFNENLDFVKTIKETSGAVVFMYGYGEKGVRINNRGRLEYTEEVGSITSNNVLTALDAAIDFAIDHGGFPEDSYLKEIKQEDKKGYYFGFGYRIEGLPVVFNNPNLAHPLEIEVYGDKVKNYRSFVREEMTLGNFSTSEPTLLPQKIIEDHIELLKADYLIDTEETQFLDEKEILNYIEKNISKAELVYYDEMEETTRQLLTPAWRIKIDKRVYYFNSYDGELLHSSLVN
ncbi:Two-component signal transduction system YycFG, regulatory protein YycH [Anaerovirgula multivorans]|uniref:Two-component signal transduction system YycFG, regulatory protein YycH n=2 Tax=Anaerovirgula multivorans TaxID=312168 RepID=A0A239F8T9_9FIRM|nr:Two-component signal transduction system YycFG, regulatory protein YycH [Anaerovirgula multivorans]